MTADSTNTAGVLAFWSAWRCSPACSTCCAAVWCSRCSTTWTAASCPPTPGHPNHRRTPTPRCSAGCADDPELRRHAPPGEHVLDRRWPLPLLGVCAMTDTSRVRELLDAANKTRSFTDSDGVVGLLILAIERLCDEVDNHERTYVGPTGLGGRFYTTQPQRDTDGAAHEQYMKAQRDKKKQ